MPACDTCNAPTVKSETGIKCMNPTCTSHTTTKRPGDETMCPKCHNPMAYHGMNSWGEPSYVCAICGISAKL